MGCFLSCSHSVLSAKISCCRLSLSASSTWTHISESLSVRSSLATSSFNVSNSVIMSAISSSVGGPSFRDCLRSLILSLSADIVFFCSMAMSFNLPNCSIIFVSFGVRSSSSPLSVLLSATVVMLEITSPTDS